MNVVRLPLPLLIMSMTLPTGAALLYFVVWAGQPVAAWTYGLTKAVMLVLPLLAWRMWKPPAAAVAGARSRTVAEGLLLGLAMAAGIVLSTWGPLAPLFAASTPRIAAKVGELGLAAPGAYLMATVAISLAHSAFEECYWRWCVFGHLSARLPLPMSHLLAGLAFAGHHVVVAGVYAGPAAGVALGLVVGAAGTCWSMLYRRHGSVLGAWIAHACCDLALMWLGWQALQQ
jgi:membrane protease YdiL (CAAX protease family)